MAEDAEYLITVGKLTQNATITDLLLYSAFKVITGCDDAVAKAVYYAIEASPAKASMVQRAATSICDEATRTIVDNLIEAVRKAHSPRNDLAHAIAYTQLEPGGQLQRLNPRAQQQATRPITSAYLKSLMEQSYTALETAYQAFTRLCEKRGVPAELKIS